MTTNKKAQFNMCESDGNAYALMGGWKRAATRQGWTQEEIDKVINECKSGDYDHLSQTLIAVSE